MNCRPYNPNILKSLESSILFNYWLRNERFIKREFLEIITCCQTFLCNMSVQRALYCLIAKVVLFYKSNNIVKTFINVTKIQIWIKKMLNKNNFYVKAIHYFIQKKHTLLLNQKMQISNINVKCKTKSATADLAKQGFLFRRSISTR